MTSFAVLPRFEPAELRTLDTIHLATALSLGEDLGALCAYDARLGSAAVSKKSTCSLPPEREDAVMVSVSQGLDCS